MLSVDEHTYAEEIDGHRVLITKEFTYKNEPDCYQLSFDECTLNFVYFPSVEEARKQALLWIRWPRRFENDADVIRWKEFAPDDWRHSKAQHLREWFDMLYQSKKAL